MAKHFYTFIAIAVVYYLVGANSAYANRAADEGVEESGPQSAALSDPTRPLNFVVRNSTTTHYQINSIIKQGKLLKALVNGKVVRVNDRVDGATIVSIAENSVVIRTATGVQTLSLHKSVKSKAL